MFAFNLGFNYFCIVIDNDNNIPYFLTIQHRNQKPLSFREMNTNYHFNHTGNLRGFLFYEVQNG